jgi:hypothetical protein
MNGYRIMVIDDETIIGRMTKIVGEQDSYIVEAFFKCRTGTSETVEAKI